MPRFNIKSIKGLTLVELIISIVIISIALTSIMLLASASIQHSADPMIQHQAVAIAESYMEEIMSKAYDEDDASGMPGTEGAFGSDAGETNRTLFDDINDYLSLPDTVVRNQDGTAIGALSNYVVTVAITENSAELGPNPFVKATKVTVTISNPALVSNYILSSYRADLN